MFWYTVSGDSTPLDGGMYFVVMHISERGTLEAATARPNSEADQHGC